ncbi:hypothetical protein B0H13DRAFT_2666221 [Mycena leptocephala]|nr:hypothetical protein B0H13DRAFT_2666221 [Mycena leptocephala]
MMERNMLEARLQESHSTPRICPGPASANTTSDITVESPSPVASPAAVDNVLEDVTNTTNVREMPAVPAKPVPKPRLAFKSGDLFTFGPRPSCVTVLAIPDPAVPAIAGAASSSTPTAPTLSNSQDPPNPSTVDSDKPKKRTKKPDALLKANAMKSAKSISIPSYVQSDGDLRNLCIQDYLAARPGTAPTVGEFESHWENLSAGDKDAYNKRSKKEHANKKAAVAAEKQTAKRAGCRGALVVALLLWEVEECQWLASGKGEEGGARERIAASFSIIL